MNAGIMALALLIGGVLVPGGDQPEATPGGFATQGPLVDYDLLAPQPSSDFGARTTFSVPRPVPTGGSTAPALPPSASYPEVPQVNRPSGFEIGLMPSAPTAPGAVAEAYPWGSPTSGSSSQDRAEEAGVPGSGPSSSSLAPRLSGSGYLMPRASRPSYQVPSTYDSFSTQQARLAPANRTLSNAPMTSISKPYRNYTLPSAISPYMELDRRNDSNGTIDNYNQYVLPRLEQANANRQMGSEIRGLQHSVQNLGRATTSVRGIAIPQYYMNYETYYPGFQR